jgi:hypothetical protein
MRSSCTSRRGGFFVISWHRLVHRARQLGHLT